MHEALREGQSYAGEFDPSRHFLSNNHEKVSLKKSLRDPLDYSRVDDLQLLNLSQMFAYSIFRDLQRHIPIMFQSIPVHLFY